MKPDFRLVILWAQRLKDGLRAGAHKINRRFAQCRVTRRDFVAHDVVDMDLRR